MNWLIFAIFAYFLWAIVGIFDGLIIKKYVKKPVVYLFIGTFLTGFLPLLIIPFTGLSVTSSSQLIVALLAGMIFVYGLLPYFKALTFEEISRVMPLWHLSPVFVLLLSTIFLDESLTTPQYFGFSLLVIGGFMISFKKTGKLFKLSKAFWLMLLATFLIAVYYIMTKYVFLNQDFINNFLMVRIGTLCGALSLLLMKDYRREFMFAFFKLKNNVKSLILGDRMLDLVALALVSMAVMTGPVSIISSLEGVQSLFTLFIVIFISIKFPKTLKEEIGGKTLVYKLLAIILMVAGIYFIGT